MGVYNTAQALGAFSGGVVGGWLAQHYGFQAVFIFCVGLMSVWLVASLSMQAPPAIKTRMFHVGAMPSDQAELLKTQLAGVAGVVEAVVMGEEGVAMLKVSIKGWDEDGARSLLAGRAV
jgi:MFS family permease